MIISASRRTDIPAFYSEWLFNRLKDGFVHAVNPFNRKQVSEISLRQEDVDCIVFWTKNPKPMLKRLDELKQYKYYFQFTLTPYGKDVEPGLPDKKELIQTFQQLSNAIGSDKMVWRYDPIFLTKKYDRGYHKKAFRRMAELLKGYADLCVISFLDMYAGTERNTRTLDIEKMNDYDMQQLAGEVCSIAHEYGFRMESCSESINLASVGIEHGQCIDKRRIEHLLGGVIDIGKDPTQRSECGCMQSVDIGQYNTCSHLCAYCYANFNQNMAKAYANEHDKNSTIISGQLKGDETITKRKISHLNVVRKRDTILF